MSVKVTDTEGLRRIRLDRAAKKNALDHHMYTTLSEAIETSPGVILLEADGGDFCAGNDIVDFVSLASHEGAVEDLPVFRFLKALTYAQMPIVAAVQGQAVGVGTTLLLHCDQVLMSEEARLSLPFLKLGLTPEGGSSLLLTQRIGHARAFEWLTSGRAIPASEALSTGIANRIVAREALEAEALRVASQLVALPLSALIEAKALMRQPNLVWAQIVREGEIFLARLKSPEAAAAFAAFLKKA
ncbi:enoyl-CoA hydratase-related protein [Asticcacaulis sp. DXS10W]|uniref:Enoyl-CoA hydratase-related protein n=1 Tax=Asticcacaulis currens TaxID=2984210 RepID=A0ABT5IBN5_9CAUL|nr:enoyl-CoA hydratase-related protein [Asticcacaulis currens]MDC7693587.1 enoyl-CoA hydratase-related protein [Asticcacaulis currens]